MGKGSYAGRNFEIVIKNETMAGWRDGSVVCMLPDLLLMVEPEGLEGVMSSSVKIGTEMLIGGVPCHERLREALKTPAGQVAFSSERYGEKMAFEPIEALMK